MRQRRSAVLFILLLAACSKQAKQDSISALAILTAENLTEDDSLNWVGEALPALVTLQLEGIPEIAVRRVSHSREAAPNSRQIQCRYENKNQALLVSCWEQGTEKTIRVSGRLNSGLNQIADQLAKELYPRPHSPIQVSNEALQAYTEERYEDAIRLAPDFPVSYIEGAIRNAAKGDRDKALQLVQAGLERGSAIPPLYREQLQFTKASLTGDRDGQIRALGEVIKLDPSDAVRLRSYAQALLAARRFDEAAKAQADLVKLLPNDMDAWNMLGYFRAYAGDLNGAKQALEKYVQLSAQNANALDSLGEVHFLFGEFKEAEKYFTQSFQKDPKFNRGEAMYKAAIARFRSGDRAGATELFIRHQEELAMDSEWPKIRWEYLTGDPALAERNAVALAGKADGNVVAASHAVLWALARGDASAANAANQLLIRAARKSPPRGDAVMTSLIARLMQGAKVEAPSPELRPVVDLATGISLLLKKDGKAAEALFTPLYEQASPQNDRIQRLALVWATDESGNQQLKKELLKMNTIPGSQPENALESILFRKELEFRR